MHMCFCFFAATNNVETINFLFVPQISYVLEKNGGFEGKIYTYIYTQCSAIFYLIIV